MKITVVTNEYDENGGGLAFSCRRFVEMLKTIRHEVFVLTSSVQQQDVIEGGYNSTLGLELAMEGKLKSDTFIVKGHDIIISFGGGKNGYYGALLSYKTNVRFCVMYRGSDANLCKWNPQQSFYNNFACERAEKIICLSNEIADNIRLLHNSSSKIIVIPNTAIQITSEIKDIFSNDSVIIGTGATNLNEKKGVSVLLKTLSYLNSELPLNDIKLELVGNIDEDVKAQYDNIISRLDLSDQVKFWGKKNRQEFQDIQSQWDLYIQCSVCEGMGNSVLDAMSRGIPVIISNTGFIAEYAKGRFDHMVFTSLKPSDIANKICHLFKLPNLRVQYQTFYSSLFNLVSPQNVIKQWEGLLDKKDEGVLKPSPTEKILSVSLHEVAGDIHDNITTPIPVFQKFVDDIYHRGFRLCSMKDYIHSSREEKESLIVCTFDDGYEGLFHNALPIMRKYNFTATVYVCTDYFGQYNDWNYKDKTRRIHMSVEELKTLQNYGWEIGSHGVSHQSLLRLNDEEVEYQLSKSKEILENHFGKVSTYAYPYGDYSPYIEKQVKKFYESAFLLTQGGVYMPVDKHRIHRYYVSEIYQIISYTV